MAAPMIAFFIIALIILGCAVALLNFRKVIYMALALGGVFIGCSAIYLLLGAQFVGIAQILIYAGAITILIMFAIMLTNHEAQEPPFRWSARNIAITIGCLLLGLVLLLAIHSVTWPHGQPGTDVNGGASNPMAIGQALFSLYVLPFEIVSLLLIVALVGAVVVARDRKGDE
jgi:NADH-quinone oxidoreductase subunit J